MSRLTHRRVLHGVGLTAALTGLVIGGSLAYGAAGDGPVITGCLKKGNLRIVDSASQCSSDETVLSWNKQGPVGPTGDTGATGATGPQGPAGAPGKIAGHSGEFGVPGTLACTANGAEIEGDGPDGTSVLQSVSYGVLMATDTSTGQATGKRQHKPFVITKQIDKASPLLFNALVANKVVACTIRFFEQGADGNAFELYRVVLSNARITEDDLIMGDTRLAGEGPLGEYERISIVFLAIEITHTPTGTVASDNSTSAS